ncbi:hypothetical protein [Mycobacterium kiyosense]|nr:hypothetical protein IWGMT90018_47060 [Mycobacterium kiyosense]
MRESYKVIVWGPGGLGGVALWEIARLEAFELVGLRAFSAGKVGKDAGELIGINPLGVTATDDVDALLAVEADCVIYTPRDFGINNADAELLAILAAGHNVVTPLPYHNAVLYRSDGFGDRLAEACSKGGSTFHATGIDPDLISDRVLMGITGICTDIKTIRLQELWDCHAVPAELLAVVGFGGPVEVAEASPIGPGISTNFLHAIGRTVEKTLGVSYDRVEETHEYLPATTDVTMLHTKIEKGTLGRVVHRFQGWVDSIGNEAFFHDGVPLVRRDIGAARRCRRKRVLGRRDRRHPIDSDVDRHAHDTDRRCPAGLRLRESAKQPRLPRRHRLVSAGNSPTLSRAAPGCCRHSGRR